MSICLPYLYFTKFDVEDEGIFTAHLQNANLKDKVDFITIFKKKKYHVTNLKVKTRIGCDRTKFQNYSHIVKKQFDL